MAQNSSHQIACLWHLGVIINDKLNFQSHYRMVNQKIIRIGRRIKASAKEKWGLNAQTLKFYLKQLLLSIAAYGGLAFSILHIHVKTCNLINSIHLLLFTMQWSVYPRPPVAPSWCNTFRHQYNCKKKCKTQKTGIHSPRILMHGKAWSHITRLTPKN